MLNWKDINIARFILTFSFEKIEVSIYENIMELSTSKSYFLISNKVSKNKDIGYY